VDKLDNLYQQVTAAIAESQAIERKISYLDEQIARMTVPTSCSGRVARRGAVRAAMAGRDEERAKMLINRFLAEDGIDEKLTCELRALLS
jgi:hypothetical protein